MVGGCGRHQCFHFCEASVNLVKPPHEAAHGSGAGWHVTTYTDSTMPIFAGSHQLGGTCDRIVEELERRSLEPAEVMVQTKYHPLAKILAILSPGDVLLHAYVGPCFELERPQFCRIIQIKLNISVDLLWRTNVPLDGVRVIRFGGFHEPRQCGRDSWERETTQPTSLCLQVNGPLPKRGVVPRTFTNNDRLE